jgi:hypothetical protein
MAEKRRTWSMDPPAEFLRVCGIGDLVRVKELLGEGVDINTENEVCVFHGCFESIFREETLPSITLALEDKWR